ncbi:hypothetical protein MRX96_032612 [Rhipicephalus microplus]
MGNGQAVSFPWRGAAHKRTAAASAGETTGNSFLNAGHASASERRGEKRRKKTAIVGIVYLIKQPAKNAVDETRPLVYGAMKDRSLAGALRRSARGRLSINGVKLAGEWHNSRNG